MSVVKQGKQRCSACGKEFEWRECILDNPGGYNAALASNQGLVCKITQEGMTKYLVYCPHCESKNIFDA